MSAGQRPLPLLSRSAASDSNEFAGRLSKAYRPERL